MVTEEQLELADALTSKIKRRGRCSNKRDKRLSEALHHKKGEPWSEAKKLEAAAYYMVLGTAEKVEQFTGVPQGTVQGWKRSEWWQDALNQVREDHNDEIDNQMTGIMGKALTRIENMIDEGEVKRDPKTGEYYNIPVGIRDLAVTAAITFDKRQLLRGKATQRVEKVTVDERLNDLSDKFKQFASAKEIEVEVIEED